MIGNYPQRDPGEPDGVGWAPRYAPDPIRADVVVHKHTCPDGARVECRSQWIASLGRTLDRWRVCGYLIAVSARFEENTEPPDFRWLDERCAAAV